MNQIVIFFVPVNATQRDFETTICEYIPSLEIAGTPTQTNPQTSRDEVLKNCRCGLGLPDPCP